MNKEDLSTGKIGEDKFLQWAYITKKNICDVRNEVFFRKLDIDFIIYKNHKEIYIEIKTDKNIGETGNLIFEDVIHWKTGDKNGWIHYCEADYIIVYDEIKNKFIILDWKKIRPIILKCSRKITVTYKNETGNAPATCIIFSYELAKNNGYVVKTIDLDLVFNNQEKSA